MRTFFLLLIFTIAAVSCKKKNTTPVITGGGKGGHAIISVIPEFANYFVDTCTVYIKYGTHDAPANRIYDDSATVVLNDTIPIATFTGLTSGLYYLYGVGYHTLGGHPPNVKGSQVCTISKEDTTKLYLPTYPYIP